jgi:hypothetical protein
VTPVPGRPVPTLASRLPGPEIVAAVLVVIMVAAVGSGLVAGGEPRDDAGASPSAAASPTGQAAGPSPIVDPSVVGLLKVLNQRLVLGADSLGTALDAAPFRTGDVAAGIRQLNTTASLAAEYIPLLGGQTGPEEVGGRLAALYAAIGEEASSTLDASVTNEVEYRAGADRIIALIAGIPALQARLEELARTLPSSARPRVSSRPSPSIAPTVAPATPTAVPATPTAPPSVAPPSAGAEPSAVPGEQIQNPGFESGVGPPWELRVDAGSTATLSPDTTEPGAGQTSARIDILAGSTAFAGISLRQPGLSVESGRNFRLTIAIRAASPREVRVRIASLAGASYLTRTVSVTTTWSTQTFDFIGPISDANASVEIDLGRSNVTTWLDSVSFAPVEDASPPPS